MLEEPAGAKDKKVNTAMIWILVFWLSEPTNYTAYTEYQKEQECRAEAQRWQQRLDRVQSKLVAECRPRG